MAATLVKTRAPARSRGSSPADNSAPKQAAAALAVAEVAELFAPVSVAERVVLEGGYLKHPVVVTTLMHGTERFVLLSHCDWVGKAVAGRARGRAPLRQTATLHRLRAAAERLAAADEAAAALAEDPLLADEGGIGPRESASKRRRTPGCQRQPQAVDVPTSDVAVPGASCPHTHVLRVVVCVRPRTVAAVYVLENHVAAVLDLIRQELER